MALGDPRAVLFPLVAQLLLGGPPPVPMPEVRIDPTLPTGAALGLEARPQTSESPACSSRRPVCVHRLPGVDEAAALAALSAFEAAYERVVLVLGLPTPRSDGSLGGNPALDLYLDPAAGPLLVTAYDPGPVYGFDSASVFCRIAPGPPWALARAATQCVGEAVAARLDAAATPDVRRAYATALWWVTGVPTPLDLAAIDDAQVAPEVAPLTRERRWLSEGAGALFFDYLDTQRGRGRSSWVPTAVLAAAAGETRGERLTWQNEPDVLDVLRHTLGVRTSDGARLFGDFAVARAFLGTRDDGTHWPQLAWSKNAGRVRFDWHLTASTLPRRVASVRPLEPHGSLYVWVELDDVVLSQQLGFQAEWEPPVSFQWTLVRVARDGRELSRLVVPYQEQSTDVTQTITNLDDTAGLLIVGTQLGGVDLLHPFDPDLAPFEPHACTIYVTKL